MIIDITNELLTLIKTELVGIASISTPNNGKVASFPTVTFRELENLANFQTIDTGGEKHSDLSFEIEIYTEGSTQMTDAKNIRDIIDLTMTQNGLHRTFSENIPNFMDSSIYKYVLRYACTIDQAKRIYRR